MIKPYSRRINYYETDKMGITHHSNYIRIMEEARIDFLCQIGWGFDKLEAMGYVSPVVSVSCKYRESTVFYEMISVEVFVKDVKGAKFTLGYIIRAAESGSVVLTGETEHCFTKNGAAVRMKKELPDFYSAVSKLVQQA